MIIKRNYISKDSRSSASVEYVDLALRYKSVVARTCDASDPNNTKPVPTGLSVTGSHQLKIVYPRGNFVTEVILCEDDAATLKGNLGLLDPPKQSPNGNANDWKRPLAPGVAVTEEDPPPPPPSHHFDPAEVYPL